MRPAHSGLIDVGANLADRSFRSDLPAVIQRAHAAGVEQMVVTGTTTEVSRAAVDLAEAHDGLWATAGVHPHHAKTCGPTTTDTLRDLAAHPKVVAIGECGLDYFRDLSPRDVQQRWLTAQLELAADLRLPVFLHDRHAHADLIATLRAHRSSLPAAVVHCFTGTRAELEAYLELDLHIGITGWICDERRGRELREIVSLIPGDRLMLETDAPYLMPRTIRPKPKTRRNEPANLVHVLTAVAECRGEEIAAVAAATTRTARTFFQI
jgi:TatD DNase family protein